MKQWIYKSIYLYFENWHSLRPTKIGHDIRKYNCYLWDRNSKTELTLISNNSLSFTKFHNCCLALLIFLCKLIFWFTLSCLIIMQQILSIFKHSPLPTLKNHLGRKCYLLFNYMFIRTYTITIIRQVRLVAAYFSRAIFDR